MKRVLSSLISFLMVVALGVATTGSATALPCGHVTQVLNCDHSRGQLAFGFNPPAERSTHQPASQRETPDKCVHPCCLSTTTAALVGVLQPHVALRIDSNAFPIPAGKVLTGIAVAPPTGPPKLSA
jgi:hypothetical protein